jgi:hypothetical protein
MYVGVWTDFTDSLTGALSFFESGIASVVKSVLDPPEPEHSRLAARVVGPATERAPAERNYPATIRAEA